MDNSYFYIKEGDNIEISFDGDEIISYSYENSTQSNTD